MYSDLFCKVYNVFGWNYYPEIFGQQLVQWLAYKGFAPKKQPHLLEMEKYTILKNGNRIPASQRHISSFV